MKFLLSERMIALTNLRLLRSTFEFKYETTKDGGMAHERYGRFLQALDYAIDLIEKAIKDEDKRKD